MEEEVAELEETNALSKLGWEEDQLKINSLEEQLQESLSSQCHAEMQLETARKEVEDLKAELDCVEREAERDCSVLREHCESLEARIAAEEGLKAKATRQTSPVRLLPFSSDCNDDATSFPINDNSLPKISINSAVIGGSSWGKLLPGSGGIFFAFWHLLSQSLNSRYTLP